MEQITSQLGCGKIETKEETCELHGPYTSKLYHFAKFDTEAHWTRCPQCVHEAQERERDEMLRQMEADRKKAKIASLFKRAQVPDSHQDKTLENYNVTNSGQAFALAVARKYVGKFDELVKKGTPLVLHGKNGTGKSHLAAAIVNAIIPNGHSALYIRARDVIHMIRATYRPNSEKSEQEVIQELCALDLLVLEEIGLQNVTDNETLLLTDVIAGRHEKRKPTIIVTNLDAQQVKTVLGDRAYSRLHDYDGTWVAFDWEDHRLGARHAKNPTNGTRQ